MISQKGVLGRKDREIDVLWKILFSFYGSFVCLIWVFHRPLVTLLKGTANAAGILLLDPNIGIGYSVSTYCLGILPLLKIFEKHLIIVPHFSLKRGKKPFTVWGLRADNLGIDTEK